MIRPNLPPIVPTRSELTLLAVVRACSGERLADLAVARFVKARSGMVLRKLQEAGLLVGGDHPDFPYAVSVDACLELPNDRLGYGCRCVSVTIPVCDLRWNSSRGMCGRCGHCVSCHNRQPDLAEVARYLQEDAPQRQVTEDIRLAPLRTEPPHKSVPRDRAGIGLF